MTKPDPEWQRSPLAQTAIIPSHHINRVDGQLYSAVSEALKKAPELTAWELKDRFEVFGAVSQLSRQVARAIMNDLP